MLNMREKCNICERNKEMLKRQLINNWERLDENLLIVPAHCTYQTAKARTLCIYGSAGSEE